MQFDQHNFGCGGEHIFCIDKKKQAPVTVLPGFPLAAEASRGDWEMALHLLRQMLHRAVTWRYTLTGHRTRLMRGYVFSQVEFVPRNSCKKLGAVFRSV